MHPANVPLTIYAGATFGPLILRLLDDQRDPIDITGWLVWAEIRKSSELPVIHDLAPAITDAAAGEITIAATDEQTAALPIGNYRWDLMLEQPGGARIGPYISGKVLIKEPITQPA